MNKEIKKAINLLKELDSESTIIEWASPVFAFGDYSRAKVATIGINPSDKEFLDDSGNLLLNSKRRLHSLETLEISNWETADQRIINEIIISYKEYFKLNPYNQWFKRLDRLLSETNLSYYSELFPICHLDLVPFATSTKWGGLSTSEKKELIIISRDLFKSILRKNEFEYLILNGASVVNIFSEYFGVDYDIKEMTNWEIQRKSTPVKGYSYQAVINIPSKNNSIKILGFNHNIQSSYGISNSILSAMKDWLSEQIRL